MGPDELVGELAVSSLVSEKLSSLLFLGLFPSSEEASRSLIFGLEFIRCSSCYIEFDCHCYIEFD